MTATAPKPTEVFRKDYTRTDFQIDSVELDFNLSEEETFVHAKLAMCRENSEASELRLIGEDLETLEVRIDGRELSSEEWRVEDEELVIPGVPEHFCLETQVRIEPHKNTQLSGLYKSSGNYCTQCEAEGFRRITWFLDRPDVMTKYRVRLEAEKAKYPVLLSNGNRVEAGELNEGRHYAVWVDPFMKPSYLFALVAGDLGFVQGSFTTMAGREVDLFVYSEHGNEDKLTYALDCLKSSMKWDEEKFGREYDLDIYNIVAVGDFNMGAMENKSLNIFNTAYVLARPDTATDFDYERIDGVIAHEYFHNWTGNRVTCRDWFQLTLKEGLTVFRDQLYSADQTSAAVKRIEDVKVLRAFQFPEDAGPMSHSIRPDSYIAMDNFYTSTVYSKGAEVIRMYFTLLGEQGFRKGMDLYFERHDGQAVTCDDFRAAMAEANSRDFAQFENWYLQSGTPVVDVSADWCDDEKRYTLSFKQSCPDTPGQSKKQAFHIPISMGLLGSDGSELVEPQILELTEWEHSFTFEGLSCQPVPSLLRGFSAPVKLNFEWTDEQLAFLMAHDSDSFQRWEAGQKLYTKVILSMVDQLRSDGALSMNPFVSEAFCAILTSEGMDYSLQAYALTLPDESTLAEEMEVVHPDELHKCRRFLIKALASEWRQELEELYEKLAPHAPFVHSPSEAGRRRLRNLCLSYLSSLEAEATLNACRSQMDSADNMTDQFAALSCLASVPSPISEKATEDFYDQWK